MYKTLFALLAALLLSLPTRAQVHFRFGPEIGFSASRIPKVDTTYASYFATEITSFKPTVGFMAGLNGRLQFNEHCIATAALEYQVTGEKLHIKGVYVHHGTYRYDRFIQRSFHKLAIPICLGFYFGNGKVRPSVQAGVRTGLFLMGIDHFDYAEPQPDFWNTTGPIFASHDEHPFDKNFEARWTFQILGSAGVEIGRNWYIGLNLAVGRPKYLPFDTGNNIDLPNYDLAMQVIFRPFQLGAKANP